MLTDYQTKVIDLCIKDGYGTAAFAQSVKSSGKCSDKQLQTMLRLHRDASVRKFNYKMNKRVKHSNRDVYFADYGEGGEF